MSALAATASALRHVAAALRAELAELSPRHPRSGRCAITALAAALSITTALLLRVDAPWWAAISAFVSIQATAPGSIRRGTLRIVGTMIGASLGLLLSPWVIGDQVSLCLALFVVSSFGVLGLLVSTHGYAWLLGAVTADMVLLAAQSDPFSALTTACSRSVEVAIGTLAAMLVAWLLASDSDGELSPAPGWLNLTGKQWPAVQHALTAGLGVMCVPLVWNVLALPNLSQTAVTVAAVMAVPALSDDPAMNQRKIADRAMHRMLGCLIGGIIGLVCLSLSIESFLPWLLMLSVGVWIGAHVQSSSRGIGYVGTQGTVVFIMTLVQGYGPPDDIMQGINRFAGIIGGLVILLAVSWLLAPSQPVDRMGATIEGRRV